LKLISKELEPSSGSISVRDRVSYLPQKTTNFSEQTLAQILHVDVKLSALNKAAQGLATAEDISIIGEIGTYRRTSNRF